MAGVCTDYFDLGLGADLVTVHASPRQKRHNKANRRRKAGGSGKGTAWRSVAFLLGTECKNGIAS